MNADATRLAEVRERFSAIEPAAWHLGRDGSGTFVEAAGPMGELYPVARFDPGASEAEQLFVIFAPADMGFLLRLLERAARRVRELTGAPVPAEAEPAKNFAAEAAIKCGEPAFKRFLMEQHGLESPATDDRTVQKLRSLLGITSRRELNRSAAAAERWKRLRGEFEAWRRAG